MHLGELGNAPNVMPLVFHASWWTLSENPLCSHILHTCQPSYSSQSHLNPIVFEWSAREQTSPLPSETMLVHAFSTLTEVTVFGYTSSCCICQNMLSAFCACPHFTCPNSMAWWNWGPSDHIPWWHLVEDSLSIFHAPTFGIQVNQSTPPQKDQLHNHFEWSLQEPASHLQVLLN
jgi:hypothetical protein